MAKKKKSQNTQKIIQKADASNDSILYDVVSITTDTNDKKRNKEKKSYICKCKKNTNIVSYKPITWNSITKMYGNADTTQLWDKYKNKPKAIFKNQERKKQRMKQIPQNLFKDKEYISQAKPKSHRIRSNEKKPIGYSIISLYRKPNKIKNLNTKEQNKQEHLNWDIISPIINIKLKRKPEEYPALNNDGIGKVYQGRPEYYNSQRLKGDPFNGKNDKIIKSTFQEYMCKCYEKDNNVSVINNKTLKPENRRKSLKSNNVCKCKTEFPHEMIDDNNFKNSQKVKVGKTAQGVNVGHGDQLLPIAITHKTRNNKCKCNFIGKIFRHSCKCKLDDKNGLQTVKNVGDQTGEPYFEIKVDSENLQVLNALEVKDNFKTFGSLQKPHSCICPSWNKHRKLYKRNTCEKGICEKANKNKQTNFDCKCLIKNKVIKCKDTTCDSKRYIKKTNEARKRKFYQSPTYTEKYKPLFDVLLDQDTMNIVNTTEIHDIFKKASSTEICPTGICSIAADNKDIQLNCTCIKKKIKPIANECTKKSCQLSDRKCNLSYLCSRVFSKSENWNRSERKLRRHRYKKRPSKKENIESKSDTFKRKGLTINVTGDYKSKQQEISDNKSRSGKVSWCKCFCECDVTQVKPTHNTLNIKLKKNNNKIKKKKVKSKRKRHIRYLVHRQNITYLQKLLQCLKRKQVRCEKKMKAEEKAFKDREEKTNKEIHKIQKKQGLTKNVEAQHWNCLTKFVSGILNLTATSIKNIILAIFGIVINPVGSYVYTRERLKNIPGTIKRFQHWIISTWRNRSSKLSQTIKDSDTMNVIADQIEDTAFYNTLFAKKGGTPAEKAHYEKMSRLRKRRIRKRYDVALYGCRHMLLTTMRKTPCLWFYHICPDLYPQCLSLITFMNNFLSVLIYLLAFLCWTPCILSFEICRACLCCFFCTH